MAVQLAGVDPSQAQYTPFYSEENVYHLISTLLEFDQAKSLDELHVVFISNNVKKVSALTLVCTSHTAWHANTQCVFSNGSCWGWRVHAAATKHVHAQVLHPCHVGPKASFQASGSKRNNVCECVRAHVLRAYGVQVLLWRQRDCPLEERTTGYLPRMYHCVLVQVRGLCHAALVFCTFFVCGS